jgi:osmoprotectant transport system ATP-binding protein
MDEPFGAIDRVTRDRLQNEFLRIQAQMRKVVVFVTHDIDEAVKMGDRIAILREGGHLEQYDTPARVLAEPATKFVADFLGPDRGQKRLSVVPIDVSRLEKETLYPTDAEVTDRATLADALSAMLLHDADRVRVKRDGAVLGALSLTSLLEMAAVPDDDGQAKAGASRD